MQYLDENPNVVNWFYEPMKISYVANKKTGRTRNYKPDLLVEFFDSKRQLIEIKPSKRLTNRVVIKKTQAARAWCSLNDVEFLFITEVQLKELGLM